MAKGFFHAPLSISEARHDRFIHRIHGQMDNPPSPFIATISPAASSSTVS